MRLDLHYDGPAMLLGPFSADVMEYLWRCERPKLITEILDAIGDERSLNTVATVVRRLHADGLLRRTDARERGPRKFVYLPTESRAAWIARQRALLEKKLRTL